jgi:hypothetical protein
MARDTYEVRFDKQGKMIVDDPELARRILYLLRHDLQIELRLRGLERLPAGEIEPLNWRCPEPQPAPGPRNGTLCPNMMCMCGALRVVDEARFREQWDQLGQPPREI